MPVAAATACPEADSSDLHGRLRRLFERSCGREGRGAIERLLPAPPAEPVPAGPRHDGFYWLLIPEWLAADFGLPSSAGNGLLADLRWIQYCVYGVFRLQDDLLDGDSSDPALAVQANHLLAEASRCAAHHFSGASPFWEVFQGTIDSTSRTIVRLDRLQRIPDRKPGIERRLYAELSACLKIAAAGVAIATGRERDWRERISPALDGMAVAAQIVDDLRDLSEDLAGGRINYAAWYLARPIFGATAEATEAVVASNLATTDRLTALLGEAVEELDLATEKMCPELCRRGHDYLASYREGVVGLGARIDHSRTNLLMREGPEPIPGDPAVWARGATGAPIRGSAVRPAG